MDEQNIKKEKEIHVSEVITNGKLRGRILLRKVGGFISDRVFRPSVITVFITAIMGPLAIQWVNDSLENKKLQKEVIETVLRYTSEADFSKPESVEKIGIISKMVDENKNVFNLTFKETNKAIDILNEASNDVGIRNLDKKLNIAKKNIKEFEAKMIADSAMFANLIKEREKIISETKRLRNINEKEKLRDAENKLAKIELDIRELTNKRTFYREQIKYWSEQKKIFETDIKEATEDLSQVLKKNRNNAELLEQEKEELKAELGRISVEHRMLKEKISELENENQILKDTINILKIKEK